LNDKYLNNVSIKNYSGLEFNGSNTYDNQDIQLLN